MIANELERVTVSYLANMIVDGDEPIIVENDNPLVVPIGDNTLRIYRGESNVDLKLPAIVVGCESGQEDFDTGNHSCTLEVSVLRAADEATENPDPISALFDTSTGVIGFMYREDLCEKLNLYGGEDFTAIGITGRAHRKSTENLTLAHHVAVELYCANRNLNPTI